MQYNYFTQRYGRRAGKARVLRWYKVSPSGNVSYVEHRQSTTHNTSRWKVGQITSLSIPFAKRVVIHEQVFDIVFSRAIRKIKAVSE
jgi:hypothetical protein